MLLADRAMLLWQLWLCEVEQPRDRANRHATRRSMVVK
jgi:hypothetical protein